MTANQIEFEKCRYNEIASEDNGQVLVKDSISQQIFLKKTLDIYSIPVFAYLKEHPSLHIPRIESYWQDGPKLIVIEELISGSTLEYLLENDLLSEEEKIQIVRQICDGLSFLHQAEPKIIHRDLKASNIMITNDRIVKIIDYDAAKIYSPQEEKDTVLIGTEGNAAPEQYGFKPSDERTDIYALGILLKKMFPQNEKMRKIAEKASSFSPEDRYQSAQEVSDAISAHRKKFKFSLGKLIAVLLGFSWLSYITQRCDFSSSKEIVNAVCETCMIFSCLDLLSHFTGLYDAWPLLHHRNYLVRCLGYALSMVTLLFLWAIISTTIISMFQLK
jgi:serine/threonine protein kinase